MPMDGIADYVFTEDLGEATHGHLYLAKRPSRLPGSDEHVVVKVMSGTNEEALRRITRELRAFAAASSPYLVALLDAGQQDDVLFYAREQLGRGTLESQAQTLSRTDALVAMSNVARAAHALHESGIAHRDIRPGNVWLSETGAKLGDLALAQESKAGAQVTTMVSKSTAVAFLDPACLFGEAASRASDIYSIGATLHYALSGRTVYVGLSEGDAVLALRSILNGQAEIAGSLSAAEADLVRQCIAPNAADRPATADEVADRIDKLGAQ